MMLCSVVSSGRDWGAIESGGGGSSVQNGGAVS